MTLLLWGFVIALVAYTVRLSLKLSSLQDDCDFLEEEINEMCSEVSSINENFEMLSEVNDVFAQTLQSILNTLDNAKLNKKIVSKAKVAVKKIKKGGK